MKRPCFNCKSKWRLYRLTARRPGGRKHWPWYPRRGVNGLERTAHQGFSQVEAVVRNSSPARVIPAGWEYLDTFGVRPKTNQEAYQCLAAVLADEQREGRMQQSVTRLRREILSKEERQEDSAAKRKRVQRLMKEM